MDIASMLTGAGLFAAGCGTGLSLGLSVGRIFSEGEPRKATCECTHSLAHHSPENRKCVAAIEVDKYVAGAKHGKERRGCACLQYMGPPPPEEYFVLGRTEQ